MSCEKAEDQILQNSPLGKTLPGWCKEHIESCSNCKSLHDSLIHVGSELNTFSSIKTPTKVAANLKMEIISNLNNSDKKQNVFISIFYGLCATGVSYLIAASNLDFENHSVLEIIVSTAIWIFSYSLGFNLLLKKSGQKERDLSSLIKISLSSTLLFLLIDRFVPLSSVVDFCNINTWPRFLVEAVGQKGLFFLMGSLYAAIPIFLLSLASARKYHGTTMRGAMIAGTMFFLMVSPSIFLQCQSFTFGILSSWLIGSFIGASVGGLTGIKINHSQFAT
tara:strand:- start:172 stop:1005 length:834 start_codon:yes stop_codon:yes gene_type:complete